MRLFPALRLSHKLPLALVGSAIVVAAGVGIASYVLASNALETQARQNLDTIAFERANQLSAYVASVEADLSRTAKAEDVQQAMANFATAWADMTNVELKMDAATTLRQAFLTGDAPQRIGVDQVPGGIKSGVPAAYSFNHAHYNPMFRAQIEGAGYSDIYLVDLKGNVVYSTAKQDDFGSNVAPDGGGKFADSGLGQVFRIAVASPSSDKFSFADFAAYAADGGSPRMFFAAPVFDAANTRVGVLAIALDTARLTSVISSRQGLGTTGDTIIVGADGLARSDSALTSASDVLQPTFFDGAVKAAIDGKAGETAASFRGAEVIAAAAPARITPDQNWSLVALMDKSEIFAPVTMLTSMMLGIGGGLLIVVALLGWLFALSVSRPINRLTKGMNALAGGDLDVAIAGVDKRDELGEMARAVEVFRANARRVEQLTDDERTASAQRRSERAAMMETLSRSFGEVVEAAAIGDFGKRVDAAFADDELNSLANAINNLVATVDRGLGETGEVLAALAETNLTRRVEGDYHGAFGKLKAGTNAVADKLADIVMQLRDTSRALKIATGEILSGANDLSERTTQQAAAIEETSAAMEQLSAMVADSARTAAEASTRTLAVSSTAEQGGAVIQQANAAMERITTSSGKISNIIGLIDDIAFQTNLLALNASVEAARAGEAGKGFAVVAVEVRRLAQSAAGASSEVKALVEQSAIEVKTGSKLVADAAGKLDTMVTAVRANVTLINGIAERAQEQAAAIEEVNDSMRRMDEMTQHNAALVEETNAAIEQTEAQAVELDHIVDVFTLADSPASRPAPKAMPEPPARGIKALQRRVATAARTYLGNTALKDFEEF